MAEAIVVVLAIAYAAVRVGMWLARAERDLRDMGY